ncbi:MAG: lysylphosphatidylglycerol synthase domain-containing protein, partial [Bacteroidales bacterium]|nr:lysylphosphatidylglycerol synthase domain-containing protein [Bacteroidales bacterium]
MHLKFNNKHLVNIFKVLIVIAAWTYIVYKLVKSGDLNSFPAYFKNISATRIIILLTILLLMPLNWLIEAIKWRKLICHLQELNVKTCFKAVWTGVTVGTITPNRIGEFGGRILFLDKDKRITAAGFTLYGDLSQFIITFVFGILSFILLINLYVIDSNIKSMESIMLIMGVLAIIISSFIYFRIEKIISFCLKFPFLNKITKNLISLKEISKKLKTYTLILSFLRYLIFTSQFYLSLVFFGIDISYLQAFIAIASIYFAATTIPNIPFAEL